ncbi:hypothetical protein ON010_g14638 [Phytophthora cinnamomi]|nr:hypothetical protein ON010_g14638 [Phytophthora cinnamomi]
MTFAGTAKVMERSLVHTLYRRQAMGMFQRNTAPFTTRRFASTAASTIQPAATTSIPAEKIAHQEPTDATNEPAYIAHFKQSAFRHATSETGEPIWENPINHAVYDLDKITNMEQTHHPIVKMHERVAYMAPVDTEPVDTQPVDTEPVDTQPVVTEPVDTQPVDTQPVETPPVDTQPVEPIPSDCSGGKVSQPDGSCQCPPDQEVGDGDVCVDKCYWRPGNAGYSCAWSNQDSTPLTLNGDCEVDAPVASDVYVNDERANQYDSNFRSQDPLIELGSTPRGTSDSSAYQTTWRNYALTPSLLEDSVTFSSFGVYDLSMVATNYRKRATCSSCIAIVDDYQPTPIESCQTAGKVLVDYSSNNLDATIKAEAAFKSFYDDANVLDNGDVDEATGANVRDDDQTAQVQDFFATEFSDVDFETSCFASSFATDLIAKMTNTFDPNDLLECKRCCHKTTTLGGTYYDYSCDASPAELKHFEGRDEDSCSFDRCITMTGSALVDTTTTITDTANVKSQKIVDGLPDSVQLDGSTIHRSIPCTTHDATNPACAFRAQIDTLFKPSASWNKDLGVPDNYAVDDYVRWNYYVGIGGVQEWNPQDVLEFTDSSTDVVVRAYTQCGLVAEFEFQVVLYPHNSHDACASFDAKWVLAALSSNQVTPISPSDKPASCAYPGSDFAVATFTYDIDDIMTHSTSHVQGTYTDVKCYATVASAGHLDDVSEVELPLGSWTPGTKINLAEQLALELVHEPSTALDTDVRLRCDFTFQHYDETTTVTEPCKHEITITECSEPEIEQRGDEVCTDGKCLDPVGAPGPYEACGGVVVTTTSESDETKTAIKAVDDTCCAACSTTLYCNALPEASGVKRCELKASGFTIVALASSIQNGDFNAGAMAAVGVSAMVAIIAVVIVKRRAAANRLKIDDDVYYPLLE